MATKTALATVANYINIRISVVISIALEVNFA